MATENSNKGRGVVLAAACVTMFFISSIALYSVVSKNLLAVYPEWSSALTWAFPAFQTIMAVTGIFAGRISDKIGPRNVVIAAAVCYGAGWFLSGTVTEPWQFYLYFSVIAGIGNGLGYNPALTCGQKWFIDKKGLASGITLAASTAGPAVLSPVLASLLIPSLGIFGALKALGVIFFVTILLSALLLKAPNGWLALTCGQESSARRAVLARASRANARPGRHSSPAAPGAGGCQPWQFYLWFSVVAAIGNGLGYNPALTTGQKWFIDKKGLASGITLAASTAGPAVLSPVLASLLIPSLGIFGALKALGVIFFVTILVSALLLKAPKAGWLPEGYVAPAAGAHAGTFGDLTPAQMVRTPRFWVLIVTFAFAATAGTLLVGKWRQLRNHVPGLRRLHLDQPAHHGRPLPRRGRNAAYQQSFYGAIAIAAVAVVLTVYMMVSDKKRQAA